jgi:hypothetical protein
MAEADVAPLSCALPMNAATLMPGACRADVKTRTVRERQFTIATEVSQIGNLGNYSIV